MSAYGVIGNPAGMRAFAARCRAEADTLTHASSVAQHALGSMHFEAPAADRLRNQIAGEVQNQRAAAQSLYSLADLLLTGATSVEREVASRRAAAELAKQQQSAHR
jgi:hypothetical protein